MTSALQWVQAVQGITPAADVYCQTRDSAQARVEKFGIELQKVGWDQDRSALLAAITGELTGNCFDHNIGMWHDISGCWFEYTQEGTGLLVIVADRGQGVLESLKRVQPDLESHEKALALAFSRQLSGRAPEKRGNGLKFVLKSFNILPKVSFLFRSGDAALSVEGKVDVGSIEKYITEGEEIRGTYAEIHFLKMIQ
ncbi:MAG: hypothetical protein HYV34_00865 [Candidatus Kerfeldbacteria bacterium]|nr:hypothetical protein [Candidatus Kerfeldbacteria bacterium]